MNADLTSADTLVESPFVIVKIGNLTIGDCTKSGNSTKFPNFLHGIRVVKINGAVNTYTLNIKYQISVGDDPNLIDKALSSIADNRRITISYGDWAYPSSIYKEETAIISTVKNTFDFTASRIDYTISAVSETQQDLNSKCYNFAGTVSKPSDVMKSMVKNKTYGITAALPGLNGSTMNALIAGDDAKVHISPKNNTTVINYFNYLTSCMTSQNGLQSTYKMTINDSKTADGKGASLSVQPMSAAMSSDDNTYTIDIGYPTNKFVTAFNILTDNQWSILYKGDEDVTQSDYCYTISDDGKLIVTSAPSITKSKTTMQTEASGGKWWKDMTEFPITAQVTLKGLTKVTMLMSYVKVNVVFYGQQHISSGLYCIQKDEMFVDAQGFKTTLTLVRVAS